jgi:hypothetical protein
MQIKRLNVGFWRKEGKIVCAKPYLSFEKACCACYLLTLGPICVTWMGQECLDAEKVPRDY